MEPKSFEEMSEQEFEELLDKISEGEFDKLTLPSFMDTLWALETARAQEVIEVAVTVEGDALRLSGPEGVIMRGNEIIVNGKRIVVKLAEVKR
jgi:hypothetical protein